MENHPPKLTETRLDRPETPTAPTADRRSFFRAMHTPVDTPSLYVTSDEDREKISQVRQQIQDVVERLPEKEGTTTQKIQEIIQYLKDFYYIDVRSDGSFPRGGFLGKNKRNAKTLLNTDPEFRLQIEKLKSLTPTEQINTGRRSFLKTVAAVTIAGSAVGLIERQLLSGQVRGEQYTPELLEQEIMVTAEQDADIRAILEKGPSKTLEEDHHLHEWFIVNYPYEKIRPSIGHWFTKNFHDKKLLGLLKKFHAEGYVYRYAQENPKHKSTEFNKFFNEDLEYYAVYTEDFLPTADEIRSKDIDPRLWIDTLDAMKRIDNHWDVINTKDNIRQNPGWTTSTADTLFHAYLNDESVRQSIQSTPNMTLVEAFSTIKASIMSQIKKIPKDSKISTEQQINMLVNEQRQIFDIPTRKETITQILTEREKILDREIVSPSTERMLYVFDPSFREGDTTLQYALKDHMPNAQFVGYNIKNSKGYGTEVICQTIAKTKGDTVIYFNVHSGENVMEVGDGVAGKEKMDPQKLVQAWIERILNHAEDIKNLGKITLLFDGCHAYDAISGLSEEFAKEYKKQEIERKTGISIEKIPIPTVITATHDGALAFRGLYPYLSRKVPEGQKINFEWMMSKIQPAMYPTGHDMTIFTPNVDTNNLEEIGRMFPRSGEESAYS